MTITSSELLRYAGVRAIAMSLCLAVATNFAQAADIRLGDMKANRILFFGNSLTIVPQAVPDTNWTGGWGMASSVPEKDYVHLVTNSIAQAAGSTPAVMATYNLQFELNYATYNLSSPEMQAQLAFQPDIVVVAIGENVPPLNTPAATAQYTTAFGNLLALFKSNGNPEIFVRSCFWVDATKDNIMKEATLAAGGVFVDQSSLGIEANWASQEAGNPFRQAGHGVNMHPGDKGMKAIADSLYRAIEAHAVPEPGSLSLLAVTVPFAIGLMGRRRCLSKAQDIHGTSRQCEIQ